MTASGPIQTDGRSPQFWIILAGLASGLLVAALAIAGVFESSDLSLYDRFFELRGPRPPRAPIVIVAIDDRSTWELNQWFFTNATHGQLIDRVSAGRPLVIGVDLALLRESSRVGPRDDEALGAALARAGNVVLAAAPSVESMRWSRHERIPPMRVREIRARAFAIADARTPIDVDGHARRERIATRDSTEGIEFPAFPVALYNAARNAGVHAAPPPKVRDLLINFRGAAGTFPSVSYYAVLRGEVPANYFRGKIVLIGMTIPDLHDFWATPFAGTGDMSGVEIHANAIETLVQGDGVREVPPWASAVLAFIVAVAGAIIVGRQRLVLAPLIYVAIAMSSYLAFSYLGIWFRSVPALVAAPVSVFISIVIAQELGRRAAARRFGPGPTP